ncbi:MAG: hypothetical protein A2015_13795 [Spirochaetes bacterium GWF1_31_7]|nr:MAG: hypothetical protein A2Y30_11030 [Spirochaetes bacterium GWE1_32_154]OHD46149.1 MAG: hypothetical protein A2Y29_08590 [Spirochaetes bacterium GWE2_31_10]OHD49890.1 MAG: hypothetical protein A2015_13795 [Spirochaetes bacterium GWF1_31_7]OHD78898.1 MAG: hypothetical protein A2355_01545 [Spirochaetes bacterium RIFOXYB1_FULL_32_8]HBD96280.1 hypothetical protein [Spirochaetia bacterium]
MDKYINNFTELMRFFLFFFIISFMLLITYSLSFYISDLVRIFRNPLKIIYIVIYSSIAGFYFSAYIVYNVKKAKVLFFISGILTLFYLHEYQRNIFFYSIDTFYSVIFSYIYLVSGIIGIVLATIALVIQLKGGGNDFSFYYKKNKNIKDSESFI